MLYFCLTELSSNPTELTAATETSGNIKICPWHKVRRNRESKRIKSFKCKGWKQLSEGVHYLQVSLALSIIFNGERWSCSLCRSKKIPLFYRSLCLPSGGQLPGSLRQAACPTLTPHFSRINPWRQVELARVCDQPCGTAESPGWIDDPLIL